MQCTHIRIIGSRHEAKLALIVAQCLSIHLSICVSVRDSRVTRMDAALRVASHIDYRLVSFSTPKQHNITKIYTATVTQYTVTIDETLIESYFTISICIINEMLPHTLFDVTHISIH